MSDVFISYSQPDGECAHEMVSYLEAHGVRCWIAPRDIAPASDWAEEIIDAISAARVMVLVFSAGSNQSPQVRREVERAVHKRIDILPFRIADVLPSKSLEFFLSAQHWMDAFPPPREPHYQRLLRHLDSQLSAPVDQSAPAGTGGARHALGDAELLHIEAQLADYIGPLAKHLVKRAALRSNGAEDLISRLAGELTTETERRAFARRCRRLPGAQDRAREP